jgi:hypothetical protein
MKVLYSLILLVLYSAVVFSANLSTTGNEAAKEVVRAKRAFNSIPASLDSDIPGIVESSIYNAIIIKNYYPSADYSRIIEKLNEIAEVNPDPSMRVKAHLASIYISSSDIITIEPKNNVFDHEYIYRQITEQLDKKLLVSN